MPAGADPSPQRAHRNYRVMGAMQLGTQHFQSYDLNGSHTLVPVQESLQALLYDDCSAMMGGQLHRHTECP